MSRTPASDLEIARAAQPLAITEVAAALGIPPEHLNLYGRTKAKVDLPFCSSALARPRGKLILVTAITPTPAGEGKTTTTIGLTDALNRLGRKAVLCIREPSLGPTFGSKGGATGGGFAQVLPMEEINLHFTGDFHAIGSAHNLLAACLDNHLRRGSSPAIDPTRILWKRVLDLNDRALRQVVVGLGGPDNGPVRETGFEITAASEVMAVVCLAESLAELKTRLGRMVVALNHDRWPVTAAQLKVHGAMAALLREALQPNLVQTLEHSPALIHGGPFANIAHGCSSVIATKLALGLAEYAVTEAGFGADLGAEKFLDIKCRQAGLKPAAAVLVATVRALKAHAGVARDRLDQPDPEAVRRGLPNLAKHLENLQGWGLPALVAINLFSDDSAAEVTAIQDGCAALGVTAVPARHWAEGGTGAVDLAQAVLSLCQGPPVEPRFSYPLHLPLWDKVRTLAQAIYGAADIQADPSLKKRFQALEASGYGQLPVCIAKTPYSLSNDPAWRGRPTGFDLVLREVSVAAGAGFVVVRAGAVMTMPGLPASPAAERIDLTADGSLTGL